MKCKTLDCNDEVQTIEHKSCSKRHITIASEYDYRQLSVIVLMLNKTQSAGSSSGKVFSTAEAGSGVSLS